LGPEQPVSGVQAQGLDGDQPILTSIEAMAARYVEEIQKLQPAGPYLLGGYCMGGTIALEIAQRLTRQGHHVALLALLETYNWRNMVIGRSAWELAGFFAQKIRFHWRNFQLLNTKEKQIFLAEKLVVGRARLQVWYGRLLSKLGRPVSPRNAQQMRLGHLWATNDQAALNYHPVPYSGRITHLCPREEYTRHQGPHVGWEGLAAAGVDTHVLPLYPAAMLVEPFVVQTAEVLQGCIDRALAKVAAGGA
jgi:thioesterase domain-containing protein